MLTGGRTANHVYVSVVGDGDPHTVIQPNDIHLRTATELLDQILARDATRQSATTVQREQQDPAARSLDALYPAAQHLAGSRWFQISTGGAERLLSGVTGEPAWPTPAWPPAAPGAAGADPVTELSIAAATGT